MRKAIVLAMTAGLTLALALTLVGCGGGSDVESASSASIESVATDAAADSEAADAAAAGKPNAQAPADSAESAATTSATNSTPDPEPDPAPAPAPCPWNISAKTYAGYDRFSGEKVDGLSLVVHEITADRIVFDYATPARTLSGIAASVDSSGHASTTQGTVTLELTLGDGSISVDEIEGMGAMAYTFR